MASWPWPVQPVSRTPPVEVPVKEISVGHEPSPVGVGLWVMVPSVCGVPLVTVGVSVGPLVTGVGVRVAGVWPPGVFVTVGLVGGPERVAVKPVSH